VKIASSTPPALFFGFLIQTGKKANIFQLWVDFYKLDFVMLALGSAFILTVSKLLSKNLKRLRQARGWTLQHIADQIGISTTSIHAYETQGAWPSAENLAELADVFGVPVAAFFEDAGEKEKPSVRESLAVICDELGFSLGKEEKKPKKLIHAMSLLARLDPAVQAVLLRQIELQAQVAAEKKAKEKA
jgi:transcriptional regulator with XRE-family HTH domain